MNLQELNQLQQETWTAGDFPKMGVELSIVGELPCESVPVLAGDRVLDVGTASGNTALAAARRRASVTGIDITPALLERPATAPPPKASTLTFRKVTPPRSRSTMNPLMSS
jgi:2-polyprenyl-3-methyl-5-hydroxy-6-metoxy-1,4-benzoquinol methylase